MLSYFPSLWPQLFPTLKWSFKQNTLFLQLFFLNSCMTMSPSATPLLGKFHSFRAKPDANFSFWWLAASIYLKRYGCHICYTSCTAHLVGVLLSILGDSMLIDKETHWNFWNILRPLLVLRLQICGFNLGLLSFKTWLAGSDATYHPYVTCFLHYSGKKLTTRFRYSFLFGATSAIAHKPINRYNLGNG